jgi:biopolymer transport protein ExbB
MSFDLWHIWTSMGGLSKGIASVLILMAIASIGVVVERTLALRRSAKQSRDFARRIGPLLDEWKVEEIIELCETYQHSSLARLFGAILQRYVRAYEDLEGGLTPVDMAQNEAERAKEAIGAELRRGMNVLASVGSVAPFVGLLGTVVGIIAAFQGIGKAGSGGIAAVSLGISEALIETALGLMVAIPAVLLFNYLTARVNTVEMALARSSGELLDELENRYGRKFEHRAKQAA